MNVVIWGANGRMGKEVAKVCEERHHTVFNVDTNAPTQKPKYVCDKKIADIFRCDCTKSAKTKSKTTSEAAKKSDNTKQLNLQRFAACLKLPQSFLPDVVIDFSVPQATKQVADFCKRHRCPLVEGVTGRTVEQQVELNKLSQILPVVEKSNFSQGIQTLDELCKLAAELLPKADCEIVETHRRGKQDSPSGTAKSLASTLCRHLGNFRSVTVHSLRCGSCPGKHTVVFGLDGESLTLTHTAEGTRVFALGAVVCAENLVANRGEIPSQRPV